MVAAPAQAAASDPSPKPAAADPPPAASSDPPPGDPRPGAYTPPPIPIATLPPQSNSVPGVPDLPPIPVATLPPQPQPQVPGEPSQNTSAAPPAAQQTQPQPGPFAGANQPPTLQEQDQAAAQQAQEQADRQQQGAVETQQAKLNFTLQDVNERFAGAVQAGNSGAATQYQQQAVAVTGQIQGQIWAGLGTTPPQPFAPPEVPAVFLNFPA